LKRFSFVATIALVLAACSGAQGPTVLHEKAPAVFKVGFETSRGPFVVEITRDLAPNGADRFYSLIKANYFEGARFYRVVPGFMVQWGAAGDPKVSQVWEADKIDDDPVKASNVRGMITFAASSAPNSRTSHMFINYGDNSRLDGMGFAPIGKVISGMENVDQIYSGDGERPDQMEMKDAGNSYLTKQFPNLDYIKSAKIVN
jgi:peptidyl-prolyl cis-trans isomerase A (cyclophilin A)